ncbi:MAG: ATPase domain-containing protein [Promethearchaeota archaeon]
MSTIKPLQSGAISLDEVLGGGLNEGEVLQVFGPGGVGKTTLALQFSINVARKGNRVIYVNSEGKFPILRLKQMTPTDFDSISPLISIVSPTNFIEQANFVSQLDSILTSDTKLLVFDTIVSHYRKEYGTNNVILNRKLNQQLGLIVSAARSSGFSVIMINQVRGDIEDRNHFLPVAESVTSYWSTYILQITRAESKGYREFKLIKEKIREPIILMMNLQSSGFRSA